MGIKNMNKKEFNEHSQMTRWSFGYLVIWSFGHLVIWSFGFF